MCLQYFYEKNLKPDLFLKDLLSFDWQGLSREQVKLIFLDIDNTLAQHGSTEPDHYAQAVVEKMKAAGFKICVLSNAKSERSKMFAIHLQVDYMNNALKPSPRKILEKLASEQIKAQEAVMIGDQLFTDIWAGKNASCRTILVQQLDRQEALQIKIKRLLERFFLKHYETRTFL